MANITHIPSQTKPGIEFLLKKSKEEWGKLISDLSSLPEDLTFEQLSVHITQSLNCSSDNAEDVGRFIIGLFQFRTEKYLSAEIITEELCSLLEKSAEKEIKLAESKCSDFKSFISQLLEISNIGMKVKGMNLMFDYTAILENSTILTDFRPIYEFDLNKNVRKGIISHILKINYRENYESKSIYLTMDTDDLKELNEKIDRAVKKENILRKSFGDNITFFTNE